MKEEIRRVLEGLTKKELEELFEAVAEALEEKELEEAQGEERRVHYEVKFIRGKNGKEFGPYLYIRWRENGKHKSRYLGRVTI